MTHQIFHLPKAGLTTGAAIKASWKVYLYVTGTTTLAPAYTSSALDPGSVHAQPVQADSGGTLPAIYLDPAVAYKASVYDQNDVFQYTVDPVNDLLLNQSVIGQYLYPQTAAELSAGVTPTNYAYEAPYVERYGAVGDGSTNDKAAFTSAFAANNFIRLISGKTYNLGTVTSNTAVFSLTGTNHRGVHFNGAKIVVQTSGGDYNAALFELNNMNGFTLHDPWIEDTGFDQTKTWKGITVVRLHPTSGEVRNVFMRNCKFNGVVAALDTDSATNRASGIWFNGDMENCYYGINLANNGDGLFADYRTKNAVRSYFCYGIQDHDVSCISDGHAAVGNADFLVKCKTATYPTRNIRARFVSKNSLATTNPQLVFESQNDSGDAAMTDIDINYSDVGSGSIVDSIAFRHYSDAGVLQATDPNTKGRIKVRGYARGTITYSSVPTATQDQDLDGCQGPLPSFCAYKSSATNDVTGDGTVYDVVFDTELHDIGSCYNNSTGVFTAPRDGVYHFSACALMSGVTVAETRTDIKIATTPKTFSASVTNSTNPSVPEVCPTLTVAAVYLKNNETAKVQVLASNGTKVVDLFGDSTLLATVFSGGLVRGGPKSP